MLELAKEMKHLVLFAHISTAYCHLDEKVSLVYFYKIFLIIRIDGSGIKKLSFFTMIKILHEKTYPPPADPHKIIKCVEWMDDDVVEAMTDKILGNFPNTYAFTKSLSEGLVEEAMPHIPVVLLR